MLTLRRMAVVLAFSLPAPAAAPGVVFVGSVRDPAGAPLASASVSVAGTSRGATTDGAGRYSFTVGRSEVFGRDVQVTARRIGYEVGSRTVRVAGDTVRVDFVLRSASMQLEAVVVTGMDVEEKSRRTRREAPAAADQSTVVSAAPPPPSNTASPLSAPVGQPRVQIRGMGSAVAAGARPNEASAGRRPHGGAVADSAAVAFPRDPERFNTESYSRIYENPFVAARTAPLSTFSIDVDRASYANVRRFIVDGQRPPADAVRIEELVNYFTYRYPEPRGEHPFSVTTEVAAAPWSPGHQLVRIGLQGRHVDTHQLPPTNLVFLIDVSGSMQPANKLPLVRQAFKMLVNELRDQDRVAIVVYAGAAGLVLPSTRGSDKDRILAAIDRLEAGGSTAGGAGLRLAYDIARQNYRRGANNRVILATDGDFNVGESSDAEMVRLIEQRREEGTYLTVLGVGTGNLKDSKMEQLADKGNGNYAYLDNLLEAQKALVHEMGGTLLTIAKDVKLQVEFNPARVAGYRLVGYENRALRNEDFNDDRKDAGELGAGHTVTALYEIIPVGARDAGRVRGVDPLRYQTPGSPARVRDDEQEGDGADFEESGEAVIDQRRTGRGDELLYVKLRYKHPSGGPSRLLAHAVHASRTARPSADFTFASAVAMFGLVLRDSEYKGSGTLADAARLARRSLGADAGGYRAEFVRLAERASTLVGEEVTALRDEP